MVSSRTPQAPEISSPSPEVEPSKASASPPGKATSSTAAQALLAGLLLGIGERDQDRPMMDVGETLADKLPPQEG